MSLVTLLPLAGLDLLAEPMVVWQCHASTAASTLIFLLSLTATCLIAADQGTCNYHARQIAGPSYYVLI